MALLSVSLFAADIMRLKEEISCIPDSGADRLHIDIMDGHFVPLFGFNNIWIRSVLDEIKMPAEFHFMAYLTEDMLERFLLLKPKEAVIHLEAYGFDKNMRLLGMIRKAGIGCGMAISPDTSLGQLTPYLPYIDTVLVMSRKPGEESSIFTGSVYDRIRDINKMICQEERRIKISVDGGLNAELAARSVGCGAGEVVIGRAFYKERNKRQIAEDIHKSEVGKEV